MVNYNNGKIYKIVSDNTDKIYIGSTTKKYLSHRLKDHKYRYIKYENRIKEYHYISSFEIIKFNDARIVLIELYPCNSKDELRAREEYYRQMYKDVCVNKFSAHGQSEESKKKQKEYHQTNRYKELMKSYRSTEKYKQRVKKYYETKKYQEYKEQKKEYNKEYCKITTMCCCGSEIRKTNFAKHKKSLKHKNFELDLNKK